jgi:WS/DGAT/MGAT family acyltransferase
MDTAAHERMSGVDTAWLRMDGPAGSMMIVGVGTTATPMDPGEFRRMVEQRVLCFPRFRQKAVADPLGASWVEDADFDLDAHVIHETLAEPAGRRELEALAGRLASRPLDPQRPLWQLHLVEHYQGGSAWVMRVHHCYADGIAMIRVLLSMAEQDPGAAMAPRPTAVPHEAAPDGATTGRGPMEQLLQPASDILESALVEGAKMLELGVHQLFHPGQAATLAAQAGGMAMEFLKSLALPDDPATPLRGPLSGEKAVAWGVPIPLHEVQTVGRVLGCTVNDVLMSTVAGALGRYLRERGVDTQALRLRASVPVNLRGNDESATLGNRFGLLLVDLHTGIANPLRRLPAMHDAMAALKGSLQSRMSLVTLGVMGLLPAALQAPFVDLVSRKATVVVSNVPGPRAPLTLCGQLVTGMYFWVPQSGSISTGLSLLSYAGNVYFGVISDRAVIQAPARLVTLFAREFENLVLATTVGALALRELPSPRIDTVQQKRADRREYDSDPAAAPTAKGVPWLPARNRARPAREPAQEVPGRRGRRPP